MSVNRLRELRKQFKLTQTQIGDMLGVTQQTVFAWEHGKALPQMQNALRLSEFYGVSMDYLLGLSDSPQKIKKQPATVSDDELRGLLLDRVQMLADPALLRVKDFLDGLEAGQAIGPAAPAAPDPDAAGPG